MTVEEKKMSMGRDEGSGDQFPIGMRVLAVDDDPICLKVLETLLLRCQYLVTTTNQAIKALNMLRENKDKFDLVISDVHMPDMDGFKLLELVGLEMDLPVIMLSANGETKAVMKGITHGACDYLLKPVRIEELRNIWQHVVRRRKFDQKDRHNIDNIEDHEKTQRANTEGTLGTGMNGTSDHNGKVIRKRKEQNDDDEDDGEDNDNECEDPSTQKKPRVVWSVELHRKFVAAVNQLGIDKAVPKRILDLMNVEKLTRENVASHLQKYRLYLKRLSAVASQQANMAASLGGRDPSYLHMRSFDGYGNFHGLNPFQTSGISNRPNPNLLGLPGFSPGMVQISCNQNNSSNYMTDLSKFQQIAVPTNQHGGLLQGIPTSLELDQMQQKQKRINESNNSLSGVFSGAPSSSFISTTNSSQLFQDHQQQLQLNRGLGNHYPIRVPSITADRLDNLPDLSRLNETWQTASTLSGYIDNTASSNIGGNITSTVTQMNGNPLDISTDNVLLIGQDSLIGRHTLIKSSGVDDNPKYLNFRNTGSLEQKLEDPKQYNALEPIIPLNSSLKSTLPNLTLLNTVEDRQKLQNVIYNKKVDANLINQTSINAAFLTQRKTDKSVIDSHFAYNEGNTSATSKMQGGFGSNACNFDELMNAMIKPERDEIGFVDGEIGSDFFSLSTCM